MPNGNKKSGQNANKSFGICPMPFCPHTMMVMSGSKGCVLMAIVALEIHVFFTEKEVLNLPTCPLLCPTWRTDEEENEQHNKNRLHFKGCLF